MNPIDLAGIDTGRVNLREYTKVVSNSVGGISSDVISAFADLGYAVVGNDVKTVIMNFQIDHKVIASKDDEGA